MYACMYTETHIHSEFINTYAHAHIHTHNMHTCDQQLLPSRNENNGFKMKGDKAGFRVREISPNSLIAVLRSRLNWGVHVLSTCLRVRVYVCVCVCMFGCLGGFVSERQCTHMCATVQHCCTHAHVCTCMHKHMHTCMYVCVRALVCVCVCVCVYVYTWL